MGLRISASPFFQGSRLIFVLAAGRAEAAKRLVDSHHGNSLCWLAMVPCLVMV